MSKASSDADIPVRRIDRVLAFMALGITVLSIVCFFTIMIAIGTGLNQDDLSQGIWPTISVLPLIGLPIAFLLIVALLIMSFVRRSRANKGA